MKSNILASAAALSDQDLLARLGVLAGMEREASVELVAHLATLDTRPAVYAVNGYGSLFTYCTLALRLSEDAACNRIEATRACRRFPVILDLLASGAMTLTSVRLLRRHLTPENYQAVLAKASGRSRHEIEALVAELAPRPDVPTSVRKLPTSTTIPSSSATPVQAATRVSSESSPAIAPSPAVLLPSPRPIVQATASERYRVQFTIGQETHEKLRRVQALLRREIRQSGRRLKHVVQRGARRRLAVASSPSRRPPLGGPELQASERRREQGSACHQRPFAPG